ncbi:hypothetical protein [Paenibacillus kobensis]|uniref:hypothetical protein n=1 Tax=Paenibacillus kobensis TaxID=59841 RepID=UPI000FDA80CE|nr:hypothetical protein [Paenibacillus kobensis]
MRTINLLPRVPYIVRRKSWLILLAGSCGLLLLVVLIFLHMHWEDDRSSIEREIQQVSEEVRELEHSTTKTETTTAFDQAINMSHDLEKQQADWEMLLQPLLGSVLMDGQLMTIEAGEDRKLKVTSVFLSEEEVTIALAKLEKAPEYKDMKLSITEHVKGETPGKLSLVRSDGQKLRLDNVDYYTLALEIEMNERQEEKTP